MNNAFEYILESGGIQLEKDYPYTGRDGTCKFDKTKIATTVANYSVVSLDEDQIAANLVKNGPLASKNLFNYRHICLIFPFFLKKKRKHDTDLMAN